MNLNTLLVEYELPTIAIAPADYNATAANGIWVSLKNYNSLAIILQTGAWAAGTAAVTLQQATAVAGTGAKTLNFSKATVWTNTSTTGTLTATTIVSNTFNLDTANKMYIIEVPARSLDVENDFDCVRVQVASPGANDDYYSAMYLFRQTSYDQSYTSLFDPMAD